MSVIEVLSEDGQENYIKSCMYPKPKNLKLFEDVLTLAQQSFYCNLEDRVACAAECGYEASFINIIDIPDWAKECGYEAFFRNVIGTPDCTAGCGYKTPFVNIRNISEVAITHDRG
ncbi:MAG: hypothetical protein ACPGEF_00185 [Endozoicomonas sp.]